MWIFGGKDDDNEKLNDFWAYSFRNEMWQEILVDEGIVSRSGHSVCLYNDNMIIFGGIHEVTKELDDMIAYNFRRNRWEKLFHENSNETVTVPSPTKYMRK